MGKNFCDKFSTLHLISGMIAHHVGISLTHAIVIHTLFELTENTPTGRKFLQNIKVWPGGKDSADTLENMVGDTAFFVLGFCLKKKLL